ncbi:MAG: protein kinase [Gemmatales bacterium]|nr:protein kinase [Gemmatales bacterium]MDW8385502.1 protein kinase [Gemmatales bacterium]
MAVQSALEFRELVAKSSLLNDEVLDKFYAETSPTSSSEAAKLLIEKGLLTRFQATMLLAGRYRGLVLGPYKLLEQIGQGGMGVVYLAEHVKLHRQVALKILPQKSTKDKLALERFYREARAVAALDHPNIVRAYDVGEVDGVHYLAMEYVPGVNLQSHLDKKGPMPWRTAVGFIAQACRGLQHAFERGMIHRDIKPGNLLVDRQNTLKILDLGLARCFHNDRDNITARLAQNEELTGSLDYMAPEVARGEQAIDIRSDIYSLGLTLYALITGKPPYEGTPAQKLLFHQMKELPLLHEVIAEVPPELSAVVARMIAKDPAARYPTPGHILNDLQPWIEGTPTAPLSAIRLKPGQTQTFSADTRNGDTVPRLTSPTETLPQAIIEDDQPMASKAAGSSPKLPGKPAARLTPAANTGPIRVAAPTPNTTAIPSRNGAAKTVPAASATSSTHATTKIKPASATQTVAKAMVISSAVEDEEETAEDDDGSADSFRRKGKGKKRKFKSKKAAQKFNLLLGLVIGLGAAVIVIPLVVLGFVFDFASDMARPNPTLAAQAKQPSEPKRPPTTGYTDTQRSSHQPPPSNPPSGIPQPPSGTGGLPGGTIGSGGAVNGAGFQQPGRPSSGQTGSWVPGQEPLVGMPAPEIDGEDLGGACLRLSDFRGQVVLLDFWGFWCPHCRNMIPHERQLVEKMRGRPFVLLGVNSDRDPVKLQSDLIVHQVNWRSLKNTRSDGGESISKIWGVRGWPTLYLIDHNGIIREKWVGAPDNAILDSRIEALVREAERASRNKPS